MIKCPGQDQRFWKPEDIFDIKCTNCGCLIEFFKDEPELKCRNCGNIIRNPRKDSGCAQWCKYGDQCLGKNIDSTKSLCDKLIEQMKNIFKNDTKRINHALSVLDYAEKIQLAEGGDALIVKAAAVLHDIGIQQAERKYNSNAGKYQEIEGPPIAREILNKHEISSDAIEHICKIIANHHSARNIDTIEFQIIWDADNLVNLQDDFEMLGKEKVSEIIKKRFKTKMGLQIAQKLF
ncbi:MAG: HD domain-containing protein [Sedimentisphaerales bacterium]|nr:HD domain-containing protein [Sedimentisphaerales bacterium]